MIIITMMMMMTLNGRMMCFEGRYVLRSVLYYTYMLFSFIMIMMCMYPIHDAVDPKKKLETDVLTTLYNTPLGLILHTTIDER